MEKNGHGVHLRKKAAKSSLYVDAGGNFIDTANNYTRGTSETYVGEIIA